MIIELFSGIGRFQNDEEVIYISKDLQTKPTICADVRFLPLRPGLKPRLLHGSPPCTFISKARLWKRGLNAEGLAQTFELYATFWRAVDYLQPENISFESPANIEKFLGEKFVFHHPKYDIKTASTNVYLTRKSMKRSELAPEIREFLSRVSRVS